MGAIQYTGPGFCRQRRLEAQLAQRRLGKRQTLEAEVIVIVESATFNAPYLAHGQFNLTSLQAKITIIKFVNYVYDIKKMYLIIYMTFRHLSDMMLNNRSVVRSARVPLVN